MLFDTVSQKQVDVKQIIPQKNTFRTILILFFFIQEKHWITNQVKLQIQNKRNLLMMDDDEDLEINYITVASLPL